MLCGHIEVLIQPVGFEGFELSATHVGVPIIQLDELRLLYSFLYFFCLQPSRVVVLYLSGISIEIRTVLCSLCGSLKKVIKKFNTALGILLDRTESKNSISRTIYCSTSVDSQ